MLGLTEVLIGGMVKTFLWGAGARKMNMFVSVLYYLSLTFRMATIRHLVCTQGCLLYKEDVAFPFCMHSVVFKYLSSGQWLGETLPLEEVPDPMVRLILKKVHTFFELNSRKFRHI